MNAPSRVALNTSILYGRMLITMGITLYSTRLILSSLGSTDYGIFNLIAGIIVMLSFLNAAMTTSTQRYLSYHQGRQDLGMQKKVFSNSLFLHIFIGFIVVGALELVGLFLFKGFLNIPLDRVVQAEKVYHFMSISVFFTILGVPFNGSLVAHENMLWGAAVNIVETLLKLGIAIYLGKFGGDKLVTYGLLIAGVSVVSFILYAVYCFKKYNECTLNGIFKIDKLLIKELSSFAGWNLFGSLCSMGRAQGTAVLLNIFLGTVANAAYGIANQVSSQLLFFSNTMLRAVNPQIMKSEGANDRKRMLRLSMMASKFGFFLLAIIAIPCMFEMDSILGIWLKNVPENTAIFCQLLLLSSLVNQVTIGLQSAIQATGNIKFYQSVVGSILLLNIPIGYLLLKIDVQPFYVIMNFSVVEAVACILRLFFLHKLAGLSINEFLEKVIYKEILPVLVSVGVCLIMVNFIRWNYRPVMTAIVSSFSFLISIYYFGLCSDEQRIFHSLKLSIKTRALKSTNF